MAETGAAALALPDHRDVARPEWLDYNGHLSEAYYVLVFGDATTALMDAVGVDEQYRQDTGCSLYTVEAHVRYLHEVAENAELVVHSRVLGHDTKRLWLFHELRVNEQLVATEELMTIHVDSEGAREFSTSIHDRLSRHRTPPGPEDLAIGRSVRPIH